MNLKEMRYPIGEFKKPVKLTSEILSKYIMDIESFPKGLKGEFENSTEEQLDTPYQPDSWTIRLLINNCADSHMNGLARLYLALTEDKPTIKPYLKNRWTELADSKTIPIEPALQMLDGLHKRWTVLLK